VIGLLTGAALALFAAKAASAGDRALKGAARGVTRRVHDHAQNVIDKAEVVLQPCAHGLAAHRRGKSYDYYADGSPAYACSVCGETLE